MLGNLKTFVNKATKKAEALKEAFVEGTKVYKTTTSSNMKVELDIEWNELENLKQLVKSENRKINDMQKKLAECRSYRNELQETVSNNIDELELEFKLKFIDEKINNLKVEIKNALDKLEIKKEELWRRGSKYQKVLKKVDNVPDSIENSEKHINPNIKVFNPSGKIEINRVKTFEDNLVSVILDCFKLIDTYGEVLDFDGTEIGGTESRIKVRYKDYIVSIDLDSNCFCIDHIVGSQIIEIANSETLETKDMKWADWMTTSDLDSAKKEIELLYKNVQYVSQTHSDDNKLLA